MALWWTKTPIPHPFPLPGTHNSQDAGYKFKLYFTFRKYRPFNDLMMAFGDLVKTSDSGTALAAKEGQPPLTESPGVKTVWEALCGVFLTPPGLAGGGTDSQRLPEGLCPHSQWGRALPRPLAIRSSQMWRGEVQTSQTWLLVAFHKIFLCCLFPFRH